MKLLGDVSEEDRKLAEDLDESEREVDALFSLAPHKRAQNYVCLAHDWYKMGSEEEGGRLLKKAEDICPGYFSNQIHKHTKESESFDFLVKSLTSEMIFMIISNMEIK